MATIGDLHWLLLLLRRDPRVEVVPTRAHDGCYRGVVVVRACRGGRSCVRGAALAGLLLVGVRHDDVAVRQERWGNLLWTLLLDCPRVVHLLAEAHLLGELLGYLERVALRSHHSLLRPSHPRHKPLARQVLTRQLLVVADVLAARVVRIVVAFGLDLAELAGFDQAAHVQVREDDAGEERDEDAVDGELGVAIEQDEPEDERQDEADWNEDREGYTLALVDTLVGAGQATDHEEDADVDQEDPHGDQDEEVARLYLLVQAQAQQAEEASMVRREEDEIRDQSAIDLPADPRVGRQLVEYVLLDQLALQMRLLLAPIGPIFGYLAAHLVDVHEDGRGDRDWCHL